MKLLNSFAILLAVLLHGSCIGQIIIDENDFADAGDTARLSVSAIDFNVDYAYTDTNAVWDFSDLNWQTQQVKEFLNPLFISPGYSLVFANTPLTPNRSNVATAEGNLLTDIPVLNSVFTESYNFYYKTNSLYRWRGIGMRVSGFPTPVGMNHSDTLYRFPMQFGDKDTAHSDYDIDVPQLGSYTHMQVRYNQIDGWGTLITPFGAFEVLRQVSEIHGADSLYIDTVQFGLKVNNAINREYKWIGKGQMVPLLQINTTQIAVGPFPGFEFVTEILYRDSVRNLPTGVPAETGFVMAPNIFPNPSTGTVFVAFSSEPEEAILSLYDIAGKLVWENPVVFPLTKLELQHLQKGLYTLCIQSKNNRQYRKLVLE
ncbi:MAG: T9SS type A sorting domain-containing protein [Bacteroidetes bacterium]|nr:T9SS type A sorting domain-containing protein [Bacteroidota bacterium]